MESAQAINMELKLKVKMLASVSSIDEASLALSSGVDIIDLKDPNQGALGALPVEEISNIVKMVGGKSPVSATIGDLSVIEDVIQAIQNTAKTGVDIIKIGFFEKMNIQALVQAVKPFTKEYKIIAVLFADSPHDFSILPLLQSVGFYGVMLDTANKNGHHLLNHLDDQALGSFIAKAKRHKLEVGLAGALQVSHVEKLTTLEPNYLGFRSALCEESQRKNKLTADKVLHIRNLLQKCNNQANKALDEEIF